MTEVRAFPFSLPDSIVGIPTPAEMITVREGLPLAVPSGQTFVATGLAATSLPLDSNGAGRPVNVVVSVDSTNVLSTHLRGGSGREGYSIALPPGLSAPATSTVSVDSRVYDGGTAGPFKGTPVNIGNIAVLFGYLHTETGSTAVAIEGIPAPSEMTLIFEGPPYLVPTGKRFVMTGLGRDQLLQTANSAVTATTSTSITVLHDSAPVCSAVVGPAGNLTFSAVPQGPSIEVFSPGVVAPGGTAITIEERSWIFNLGSQTYDIIPSGTNGVVLGYLADE